MQVPETPTGGRGAPRAILPRLRLHARVGGANGHADEHVDVDRSTGSSSGRRRYDPLVRRPLRLALVLVGLAAVVYGTASLTGGWLGTPPWWANDMTFEQGKIRALGTGAGTSLTDLSPDELDWLPNLVKRDRLLAGREWISGGVIALGLCLAGFGVWGRTRVPRAAFLLLGLAIAVYGIASGTGGWLGTPPWWERPSPMSLARWSEFHVPPTWLDRANWDGEIWRSLSVNKALRQWWDADWALASDAFQHVDPVQGREWISVGVVAVGLALVGVGAWPRRSKPAATTP